MAEPKLDIGDWAGLLTLLGAGIGTVIAWVKAPLRKMDRRLSLMEGTMYGGPDRIGHDTQLAVLRTTQEHTCARLTEIKEATERNQKLLNQVLMEVRK